MVKPEQIYITGSLFVDAKTPETLMKKSGLNSNIRKLCFARLLQTFDAKQGLFLHQTAHCAG